MTKNRVVNTAASGTEGLLILADAMMGRNGIEAQESRGQQQLLQSEVLPVDLGYGGDEAAYLALGFTFGAAVEGDPLFRAATLPKGWKREGSDHAMWSYIVDERGIRRASIFYKAAFYDRSAHMRLANVGREVANGAMYGDGEISEESLKLDLLTAAELADARKAVEDMRKNIAESPDIYGRDNRTTRVELCKVLLDGFVRQTAGRGDAQKASAE